jgi:hypothetical protein
MQKKAGFDLVEDGNKFDLYDAKKSTMAQHARGNAIFCLANPCTMLKREPWPLLLSENDRESI